MNKLKQLIHFIRINLWSIPEGEISKFNRIILGQVRVINIAVKGAINDNIFQKASALTYYTLWALIPVLALFFGIAKGFGFQDVIERVLLKQFQTQPEMAAQINEIVGKYLETIKGGFLVGAGIIILLWSVINVLNQIEIVFNEIWQNQKARPFIRKITDHVGLLIIMPVFVVISSGANIFILSYVDNIVDHLGMELVIAPLITGIAKTIPYILYIFMFTVIYMVMPNVKVKFTSALIPGIFVGILFQFLQILYFSSQVWFGRMHTVYSGLVALPLLLLWMQIGWTIILLGAEISFANQNIKNFMYNDQLSKISKGYQRKLSLFILYVIINRFKEGLPPLSSEDIADDHNIPIRLVNRVIYQMTQAGILCEINVDDHHAATFQPAIDINKLSISYILERVDNTGVSDFVPIKTKEFAHLSTVIDNQTKDMENSSYNVLLSDL